MGAIFDLKLGSLFGDSFGFCSDDACFGFLAKPSLWGGIERRRRSTESRARSARTLTVLMMSSRRDWEQSLGCLSIG